MTSNNHLRRTSKKIKENLSHHDKNTRVTREETSTQSERTTQIPEGKHEKK